MNVTQRLLNAIRFDTRSDENSVATPTTDKQKGLGEYLATELAKK